MRRARRIAAVALGAGLGLCAVDPVGGAEGWREESPLPLARFEMGIAVVGERLFVMGGFAPGLETTARVDRYEPVLDRWTRVADLPTPLTHFNPAVADGEVWIAGGFRGGAQRQPATAAVWRYDPVSDVYHAGPDLPEPRAGGGLAWLDGRLHYVGGLRGDRDTDAPDHWVLEPGADGWTDAAPLPAPRNQFGVVVSGGRLWVIGGQHRHDSTLSAPLDQPRVDVYDPRTDGWAEGPRLPSPLSHTEPGTFAEEGRLLVVAGRAVDTLRPEVWELAAEGGAWRAVAELPDGLLAPGARVLGDRLWVLGGALEGYRSQATTRSMPLPRSPPPD